MLEEKPNLHAICITESWLNKDKLELLNIKNYHLGSSFCRESQEGGGVCILVKNSIDYYERNEINSISVQSVFEVCAIEIVSINFLIINLYWPNSARGIDTFLTCLEKVLKIISVKDINKNIIIGGDLNVNFLKESKLKRSISNLFHTYNFKQIVKEATRVTANSSSCLDVIFTNFNNNRLTVNIQELGFSDHKGIELNIPTLFQSSKNFFMAKRLYTNNNIQKFKNQLSIIEWENIILPNKSVNENYDNFIKTLSNALNNCIPIKTIKINSKSTYLTPGLKLCCRNKRLLKFLLIKSPNNILHNYYKKYTRILKKAIQTSKKINNIRKFQNSDNISKTTWQIIQRETNKKITIQKQNIKLKINNKIHDDPKLIANTFNDFFSSICNTTLDSLKQFPVDNKESTQNSIFLRPVETKEINKIIKNLKNKNSCGIDEIPPKLIKNCARELTSPYTTLINQSFSDGIFPNALKISLIKPIYKKGEKTDPNNYRPISLLPTSAKIYETAMANRVYHFLEKYSILHENQYGFRKNRSTTLAVYKLAHKILNTINTKQYSVGLLLDMSKAYDRVRYDILLQKLSNSGIRGICLNWFKSYLENRSQFTEIENTNFTTGLIQKVVSKQTNIRGSIPQGSVLGCILFIIYINSITTASIDHCVLFADDVSIMIPCTDTNELESKLNITLNKITNYLNSHNLILNFNKTKLIQFKPYQKAPLQINYTYQDTPIETVESTTLLGIDIDSNLSWKPHIHRLAKKLSSSIYALNQLKKVTDFKTALTAYYAYIHSRLTYGIVLWGNCTDIQDIFILQKRCIRILTNIDQMESCRPHFVKHSILTLTSIYIYESCKFVKKHISLYSPVKNYESKRNNRGKNTLKKPFSKLKLFTSGPHSMVIEIYNNIPSHIKTSETLPIFLKKLRHYLISKCYYNLNEFFKDKDK